MKKYLRILTIILCGLLSFFVVSCGKKDDNSGSDNGGSTTKTVYLTYAEWGDQDVAQAMLDAFMEKHPNIKVTLDTSITGSGTAFTQSLVEHAQANMLPDVFVTDNVPTVINNGLVYDISSLWDNDADAQLVYENIAETAVYYDNTLKKNVRLAAPSYQFLKCFFVNTTLLNNLGLDLPEYDWTFEDFYNISKAVQNQGSFGGNRIFAINGYYGALDFEKAMTAQSSSGLGYDSWDGEKFNYTSEEWIAWRNKTREFYDTGLLEQLTEEEKQELYGSTDAWPFEKGHTAFAVEGSWNFITMLDQFQASGIDVEVYPYPAGEEAHQAVILDYMCVSALTDFPEEAFELLKWMSFGRDGWAARLKIMKDSQKGLDRFPVADYSEIWTDITEYMTELSETHNYEGYIYCIENLSNGAPDVDKWLPGYSDFWNYVYETDETEDWYNKSTDQLAREWMALINQFVTEAYTKLGLSPYQK